MANVTTTLFDLWPYNLLIDIFYKPEITQRVYLPAIEPVLRDLPDPAMADILLCRYRDGLKLQQIGIRMDVTAERVRQLQNNALAKLRHPTFTVRLLTVSPTEAAALNRRIRELSRACGETAPEPDLNPLTEDSPIEALNLSTRSYNGLRRMKVRMLGDLKSLDAQDMLRARGMGVRSLQEIARAVEPYGIEFRARNLDPKAGGDCDAQD